MRIMGLKTPVIAYIIWTSTKKSLKTEKGKSTQILMGKLKVAVPAPTGATMYLHTVIYIYEGIVFVTSGWLTNFPNPASNFQWILLGKPNEQADFNGQSRLPTSPTPKRREMSSVDAKNMSETDLTPYTNDERNRSCQTMDRRWQGTHRTWRRAKHGKNLRRESQGPPEAYGTLGTLPDPGRSIDPSGTLYICLKTVLDLQPPGPRTVVVVWAVSVAGLGFWSRE